MADVALDGADPAAAHRLGRRAERIGERLEFDRVAHPGGGPVRLDVADLGRVDAGRLLREQDRVALSREGRCGVADLVAAVVVEGGAEQHTGDAVVVAQGVVEPFEYDEAHALAGYRAPRLLVEGAAVPVRRENAALLVEVAPFPLRRQGHSPGEGRVALVRQQALYGRVDGGE
ncbi:hypothetical protein SJI45_02170 [Streptomyces sp. S399]|nr:hypothetical protein [Streptomyces sp. S399]WPR54881.1 hypothetical protein SJI45_02170 [Streptomyces sp. S399]